MVTDIYINQEKPREAFLHALQNNTPCILTICAESGCGKTGLLKVFERVCERFAIPIVTVDFRVAEIHDEFDVLNQLRRDLVDVDFREYSELLKHCSQEIVHLKGGVTVRKDVVDGNRTGAMDKLQVARRVLEALEVQDAGYTFLTRPPNLQIDLEEKRREVSELEAAKQSSIIQDQLRYRGEILETVTRALFEDLVLYCSHHNLVIQFDTFESAHADVSTWLDVQFLPFAGRIRNLVIVVAGQRVVTGISLGRSVYKHFELSRLSWMNWYEYAHEVGALQFVGDEGLKSRFRAAKGDPKIMSDFCDMALATKQAESSISDAELEWGVLQTVLRFAEGINPDYPQSLWAASVLHWFDTEILECLLFGDEFPLGESDSHAHKCIDLFAWLTARSFAEVYNQQRISGQISYTLHERTRRILVEHLLSDSPDLFFMFSSRAKVYFERRIEAVSADSLSRKVLHLEMTFHWFALDQVKAFEHFLEIYHDLESQAGFVECQKLIDLAKEQEEKGLLSKEIALWLEYYEGRLLQRTHRANYALERLAPLLEQTLPMQLNFLILVELGYVHELLNNPDAALLSYTQAMGTLPQTVESGNRLSQMVMHHHNPYRIRADVLRQSASILWSQENYEEALEAYRVALGAFEELYDSQSVVDILEKMGDVLFHDLRDLEHAYDIYMKCLAILQKLASMAHDIQKKRGDVLNKIGMTLFSLQKYLEALEKYREAHGVFLELNDQAALAAICANTSETYLNLGEFAQSEGELQRAFDFSRNLVGTEFDGLKRFLRQLSFQILVASER